MLWLRRTLEPLVHAATLLKTHAPFYYLQIIIDKNVFQSS
jgi:hypothetical protein